jgi:hypothetical protein
VRQFLILGFEFRFAPSEERPIPIGFCPASLLSFIPWAFLPFQVIIRHKTLTALSDAEVSLAPFQDPFWSEFDAVCGCLT